MISGQENSGKLYTYINFIFTFFVQKKPSSNTALRNAWRTQWGRSVRKRVFRVEKMKIHCVRRPTDRPKVFICCYLSRNTGEEVIMKVDEKEVFYPILGMFQICFSFRLNVFFTSKPVTRTKSPQFFIHIWE